MDLRLFARVIWRFRIVVAAGFVLAIGLAVLATAQVRLQNGFSLKYRTPTFYKADSILFVTQNGFPWGSAVQPYLNSGGSLNAATAPAIPVGDQVRLTNLAQLYAQYTNSDVIRRMLARSGNLVGVVNAQPMITNPNVGAPTLPLLDVSATASSAAAARGLAQAATDALDRYITGQQQAARIQPSDRVVIQELQRPRQVTVTQKPKKTVPILVFMTVMLGMIGLAFVLDNFRKPPPSLTEDGRGRRVPVVARDVAVVTNEAPVGASDLPAVANELRQAPRLH
jgi:hypothetical protein